MHNEMEASIHGLGCRACTNCMGSEFWAVVNLAAALYKYSSGLAGLGFRSLGVWGQVVNSKVKDPA